MNLLAIKNMEDKMKYCTNCGTDISKRGNRATKCVPCQKQDAKLYHKISIVEDLGSQNADNPKKRTHFESESFQNMLTNQHKYAILPEDNSDNVQNTIKIQSKVRIYKEWKDGYK